MIKHLLIAAVIAIGTPVSAMEAPLGAMVFCLANASQCSGAGDTKLFYSSDLIDNLQRIKKERLAPFKIYKNLRREGTG